MTSLPARTLRPTRPPAAPQRLADVSRRGFRQRWRLQLPGDNGQELARVLGGGVVPGSLTLVGGEPGVGKSTLLLQMAAMLTEASVVQPGSKGGGSGSGGGSGGGKAGGKASTRRKQDVQQPAAAAEQQADADDGSAAAAEDSDGEAAAAAAGGVTVLYVSGEESVEQVGSRAERMGLAANPSIYVYSGGRPAPAGPRIKVVCCADREAVAAIGSPARAQPLALRARGGWLASHPLACLPPPPRPRSHAPGLDPGRDRAPAAGGRHRGLYPDGLPGRGVQLRGQRDAGARGQLRWWLGQGGRGRAAQTARAACGAAQCCPSTLPPRRRCWCLSPPTPALPRRQVRECATALLQVAKRERLPVFLVGHVTKSGDLAGPRVLEHIVDAVVYMEGARQQAVRLVSGGAPPAPASALPVKRELAALH